MDKVWYVNFIFIFLFNLIKFLIGRLYFNSTNPDGCVTWSRFTNDFAGNSDGVISPIFMVETSAKMSKLNVFHLIFYLNCLDVFNVRIIKANNKKKESKWGFEPPRIMIAVYP